MFGFCFPVNFMVLHFPCRVEHPKEFFLRSQSSCMSILQFSMFSGSRSLKNIMDPHLCFIYQTELVYIFNLIIIQITVLSIREITFVGTLPCINLFIKRWFWNQIFLVWQMKDNPFSLHPCISNTNPFQAKWKWNACVKIHPLTCS